jgi:S-formylglutathione hydrolase FrmB
MLTLALPAVLSLHLAVPALAVMTALPPAPAPEETVFEVSLSPDVPAEPASGRLIVFVIHEDSPLFERADPVGGPFWSDPQPLFGVDATFTPGESVRVDDAADAFPHPPSALAPGRYQAQARFDRHRSNSSWRREAGNLWSDVVSFEVGAGDGERLVELTLAHVVEPDPLPEVEGVEWFEMRSERLSAFRGEEVLLRAGVVLPTDYDPERRYPAQYEVPGFGGDHRGAAWRRGGRRGSERGASAELSAHSFRIVLDPEGPNGHTLFADSANNGPCGEALVRELIPALESRYPLIAEPSARILRGHSSGGWSTLWLALTYPDVFGATWSSAPDPVDFRRFQKVDIYGDENFYVDADGAEVPSLRGEEGVTMTNRQESRGEDILGPDNTAGQQWDSWFAVFGPRDENGNPAALFDPETGAIDPDVAAAYRGHDIGERLRADPERYVPIFRENVRLICGSEDSFYLNEAVELLAEELADHPGANDGPGYVKLAPGDHGSVFASEAMRAIPDEVLAHFRAAGHVPAAAEASP